MRALLALLGVGTVGYLVWNEWNKNQKAKATAGRAGVPATMMKAIMRPGAKKIAGAVPSNGRPKPAVKIVSPGTRTSFVTKTKAPQVFYDTRRTTRPSARPMGVQAPIAPRAFSTLSECSHCRACPPDLQRSMRGCPTKEQDVSFNRNLIESDYDFDV